MTALFRRDWSVTVGRLQLLPQAEGRELTVKFEVNKSLEREPNSATVQIANLSRTHRQQLEQVEGVQLEIKAGYRDLLDTIFVGDVSDAWNQRDEVDVWTNIEAKDGGTSYRTAFIQASYEPNTQVVTAIRACAQAMGVGLGNTESVLRQGASLDSTEGPSFAQGVTLSGPAWRQLDRLCRSCSLRWSVQCGVLQLRRQGQPAETRAVRLSPSTGLLESPSRGKRDERTREVTIGVKALLHPGLYPGRVVTLESSEVNGGFLCERVRFVGDSSGADWYAELEVKEYSWRGTRHSPRS